MGNILCVGIEEMDGIKIKKRNFENLKFANFKKKVIKLKLIKIFIK